MIRHTKIATLLFFALLATLALPSSSPAQIAVGVSIHIGPPALPVYPQPICPAAGYIWAPGYWAYGPAGYFWVPGTWVLAPTPGFLWTPGYWGWAGGLYVWHGGYWGPHVGFYGGINYGFGYGGVGFVGGEWRGGVFHYNTAVTNVNTTVIHNTYVNNTVINRTVVNNNVSYNGGTGGTSAQPTASEQAAMHEQHVQATSLQTQHEQAARSDRTMLASVNHGSPAVAATAKPGVFHGEGVVAAHAAANTNRPNLTSNAHSDRPPNTRTNNSYNANTHANTTSQSNSNRPPNNNSNSNHPNTSKPPQQTHQNNRPPEHESHPSGGHEGGHGGR
ncbi:MAG: YXWGXW repeat-containing protein [Candidatus Acidiferrum sp.]|jgi:hypothetical protein